MQKKNLSMSRSRCCRHEDKTIASSNTRIIITVYKTFCKVQSRRHARKHTGAVACSTEWKKKLTFSASKSVLKTSAVSSSAVSSSAAAAAAGLASTASSQEGDHANERAALRAELARSSFDAAAVDARIDALRQS